MIETQDKIVIDVKSIEQATAHLVGVIFALQLQDKVFKILKARKDSRPY